MRIDYHNYDTAHELRRSLCKRILGDQCCPLCSGTGKILMGWTYDCKTKERTLLFDPCPISYCHEGKLIK